MTIEAANRTAQGLAAALAPRQPRDISVAVAAQSVAAQSVSAQSVAALSAADALSSGGLGAGNNVGTGVSNEVRSLARDLAASPPVNGTKVAELRAAIDAGAYTVQPQQLADAMIRAEFL